MALLIKQWKKCWYLSKFKKKMRNESNHVNELEEQKKRLNLLKLIKKKQLKILYIYNL